MDQGEQSQGDPFLGKEDLIARMKGRMFPKGKQLAPSLVMWGDPHAGDAGSGHDIDHLDHMSKPDEADGK